MAFIGKLSYRNVWRNRRRTFLTAGSIAMAVFFTVMMRSIQAGMWDSMIKSVVEYYVGYVQIHKDGYWHDRSIDDLIPESLPEYQDLLEEDHVEDLIPRLESFALASVGKSTKGALVAGVDPEKENAFSGLRDKLTSGDYLQGMDRAVLLSEGLAERLDAGPGDSVVLISQGYHGVNAAGIYPVKGLLHFPTPELNNQMIYMPLLEAQYFYGAEGLLTSIVLHTRNPDKLQAAMPGIAEYLGGGFEVMDYRMMMPSIVEAEALDVVGAQLMLAILYVIIAFGILGTIIMMMKERQYEFGVMKAVGMKGWKLFLMVYAETMVIGFLGCLLGLLMGLGGAVYFQRHPIEITGEYAKAYEQFGAVPEVVASIEPVLFAWQALSVLAIVSLLSLYPFIKLLRMQPVEAMRA
jgi:ABC-type lipoprotein release transport system permease subunit